jgi:hypothetical protein
MTYAGQDYGNDIGRKKIKMMSLIAKGLKAKWDKESE